MVAAHTLPYKQTSLENNKHCASAKTNFQFSLLNFDKIFSHVLSVRFFQMKISSEPRCMMYDILSISFIEWISFILPVMNY